LLDERKRAKLQWLQNPSQINGDNLNNVRRETSKIFRNKKREYLKEKINELETEITNSTERTGGVEVQLRPFFDLGTRRR
jgi:hypothetical protein